MIANFFFQNKDVFPRDLGVPDLDDEEEEEGEEENDFDSEEEEESVEEDRGNDVGNRLMDGQINRKGATTFDRDAQKLVQSLRQEGKNVWEPLAGLLFARHFRGGGYIQPLTLKLYRVHFTTASPYRCN